MKKLTNFLLEKHLSELYHYTDISVLKTLLKTNQFKCSETKNNPKDKLIHDKLDLSDYIYYISLGRNKDGRIGYPSQYKRKVRITFDADMLSRQWFIRPLDFFGKKAAYNKPTPNWQKMATQGGVEQEERLFSDRLFIDDINKYIKRIDVYDEFGFIGEEEIQLLDKLYPNKYYIYDDETKWRFQR